jgi:hypothetical protein
MPDSILDIHWRKEVHNEMEGARSRDEPITSLGVHSISVGVYSKMRKPDVF